MSTHENRTAGNDKITDVPDFDLSNYQVVRSEFFAHLNEPSITFNNCKLYLNTACIKRLPEVDYVQFMVNSTEKRLIVRACEEDAKDSFLWCNNKRKPRQITCKIFFAKLVELMNWDPDHRYKILGNTIRRSGELFFLFDLTCTEVYKRISSSDEKHRNSKVPIFPEEWKNQFGLPVNEHRKQLQINMFDGYIVFDTTKGDESI